MRRKAFFCSVLRPVSLPVLKVILSISIFKPTVASASLTFGEWNFLQMLSGFSPVIRG